MAGAKAAQDRAGAARRAGKPAGKPAASAIRSFLGGAEPSAPKVLITGISGNLGRLLAQQLHREAEVHGVDRRPFVGCPKDVVMHHIDLRKKRCEDLFRHHEFAAVYHLGIVHDPRRSQEEHHSFNVSGTMKILEYCQRYRVPKVILLSSANIYGPHPNNPSFLSEESPLLAGQRFPQIRDLIELDMLAQSFFWKHDAIETVILRPVNIVGPNMRNGVTRYFRLPVIPTLLGFDPMVQIVHEDDVIRALVLAGRKGIKGVFNVTGAGSAPLSYLIRETGKPRLPLPLPVVKKIMSELWNLKLSAFPAPEIDYARFICTVDGSRAERLLGYRPRYSLRETLASLKGVRE